MYALDIKTASQVLSAMNAYVGCAKRKGGVAYLAYSVVCDNEIQQVYLM